MTVARPAFNHAQLRAGIEAACSAGQFQAAYDLFKQNFGDAHRYGDLCLLAGIALFELGRHALALQYFQSAAIAANALDWNVSFWLARAHQKLGELEMAVRYAEHAYTQAPMEQPFFDLFKELCLRTGGAAPEHWMVIGCSHVRYFRYLQLNQAKFFGRKAYLDCYEFAGATAYGLGNTASQAGALNGTRQLRARMARADRVLVYFGEIDCRRAAWKAAQTSGRPIEEMILESSVRLRDYVQREILPHNKSVLLLGAKPQIIADDDFHKNALEDERTVFQPLAERERITLLFNSQVRDVAARLHIDYADIDHVLAGEKSRREFFKKVFWDGYTTDTHGNVDYLAGLYHQRLQEFL